VRNFASHGCVVVLVGVGAPAAALAGPPAGFHVAAPSKSVASDAERNVDRRCIFRLGCDSHLQHGRELDGAYTIERIDVPLASLPEAVLTIVPDGEIRALRRVQGSAASDMDPAHRPAAIPYAHADLHVGLNFALETAQDAFSVDVAIGAVSERWHDPFRFEALGSPGAGGAIPFDVVEGETDENHPMRVRTWLHGDAIALRPGLVALLRREPTTSRRWVVMGGAARAELPVDLGALGSDQPDFAPTLVRDRFDRTAVFGQLAFVDGVVVDVHAFEGEAHPVIRVRLFK